MVSTLVASSLLLTAAYSSDGIVRSYSELGGKPYNVTYDSRSIRVVRMLHVSPGSPLKTPTRLSWEPAQNPLDQKRTGTELRAGIVMHPAPLITPRAALLPPCSVGGQAGSAAVGQRSLRSVDPRHVARHFPKDAGCWVECCRVIRWSLFYSAPLRPSSTGHRQEFTVGPSWCLADRNVCDACRFSGTTMCSH